MDLKQECQEIQAGMGEAQEMGKRNVAKFQEKRLEIQKFLQRNTVAGQKKTFTCTLQAKKLYTMFKKVKVLVRKLGRQKRYSKYDKQEFEESALFQTLLHHLKAFLEELKHNPEEFNWTKGMKAQVDHVFRKAEHLLNDDEDFIKGVTHVGV